jgi:hypothetical protein
MRNGRWYQNRGNYKILPAYTDGNKTGTMLTTFRQGILVAPKPGGGGCLQRTNGYRTSGGGGGGG